ncbi:MAG: glycosyltransferase family 39 protein [Cytophagaceae bacterium]
MATLNTSAFFSRERIIYYLILTFTFALSYSYIYDKKVDKGGDSASYYMLGKSIAQGDGYSVISAETKPAANHYPPGYPAIVGVVMKIFSDKITTVIVANGIMFLASVILLFELFLLLTASMNFAFIASALLLVNYHLLRSSTMMMSEIPFTLFSALTLVLFIKNMEDERAFFKSPSFYLAVLMLAWSYYIRSAGIALVGAILLYLLINKKWTMLVAYATGFVALALPWFLRGQSLGGNPYIKALTLVNYYKPSDGYMDFNALMTRFLNNVTRYITKEVPDGVFPSGNPGLYETEATGGDWLVGLFIFALVFFGLFRLPKYRWLILGYVTASFGILFLWPDVWYGTRFEQPVIPFLLFGLVYGVWELAFILTQKMNMKTRINPLWFAIALLFFMPGVKRAHKEAKDKYEPNFGDYYELAKWMKANVKEEVTVACRKPDLFFLFSGKYVCNYKYTEDDKDLIADLKSKKVKYVVLENLGFSSTQRYLLPAIQKNPDKFKIIQQLPQAYLFKFEP